MDSAARSAVVDSEEGILLTVVGPNPVVAEISQLIVRLSYQPSAERWMMEVENVMAEAGK